MAIPTPTPMAMLPIATPSAAPTPAPIAIPAPTVFTLTGSFVSQADYRCTSLSRIARLYLAEMLQVARTCGNVHPKSWF